ncbi:MAG: hypothetical protein RL189_1856 [Pseudomonadota bacterium]|jgi:uncharacterized membrane protein YGL010W
MRTLQEWFEIYSQSHMNSTNKVIHKVCVPAITFSTLSGLLAIPHPFAELVGGWLNWATLALVLTLAFYFRLGIRTGLVMTLFLSVLFFISAALLDTLGRGNLAVLSVAVFVVAWIGQFIGHKIEGKKPSFFQDLQFLLIGPAWILLARK